MFTQFIKEVLGEQQRLNFVSGQFPTLWSAKDTATSGEVGTRRDRADLPSPEQRPGQLPAAFHKCIQRALGGLPVFWH